MDVFGKGTDEPSRPLLPPGTCWICANSPQQEAIKVIDTRRNTQAGGSLSHASNRIYICEPCAKQLGEAIGMVSKDKFAQVEELLITTSTTVVQLNEQLDAARTQQHRVVDADELFAKIDERDKKAADAAIEAIEEANAAAEARIAASATVTAAEVRKATKGV